ncbi:MAG: hypothetical protein ACE5J3_14315 [Methanosarcinales archaeon]
MKGIGQMLSYFIKIMEIAFIIMAIVVVYFRIADYELNTQALREKGELRLIGDSVLSCIDLTEITSDGNPVKGLFNKEKIIIAEGNNPSFPSCLNYPKNILLEIIDGSDIYQVGDTNIDKSLNSSMPIALKDDNGEVSSTTMTLYVS